jgi:uncharacterized protein (DUF433 family)
MTATLTAAPTVPIYLDERGVAWVDKTNTKVKEIVLDKLTWGWDADEIHENHPHLSLTHIHAAFTYYYAHQEAMDEEMRRDDEEIAAIRAEMEAKNPPPTRAELLARRRTKQAAR